jgi:hypothetical protein
VSQNPNDPPLLDYIMINNTGIIKINKGCTIDLPTGQRVRTSPIVQTITLSDSKLIEVLKHIPTLQIPEQNDSTTTQIPFFQIQKFQFQPFHQNNISHILMNSIQPHTMVAYGVQTAILVVVLITFVLLLCCCSKGCRVWGTTCLQLRPQNQWFNQLNQMTENQNYITKLITYWREKSMRTPLINPMEPDLDFDTPPQYRRDMVGRPILGRRHPLNQNESRTAQTRFTYFTPPEIAPNQPPLAVENLVQSNNPFYNLRSNSKPPAYDRNENEPRLVRTHRMRHYPELPNQENSNVPSAPVQGEGQVNHVAQQVAMLTIGAAPITHWAVEVPTPTLPHIILATEEEEVQVNRIDPNQAGQAVSNGFVDLTNQQQQGNPPQPRPRPSTLNLQPQHTQTLQLQHDSQQHQQTL